MLELTDKGKATGSFFVLRCDLASAPSVSDATF